MIFFKYGLNFLITISQPEGVSFDIKSTIRIEIGI